MDKPLELCVSNINQEQQHSMHINLPFPIEAIVITNGSQSLERLKQTLSCIDNLKAKTSSYCEPYLAQNNNPFNLVILVLPNNETEAQTALAYASNFESDIVLIGINTPQNILRLAFQYEVTDFVPYDSPSDELITSITKISNRLVEQADLAPVVAVLNGKSGSGASFICASLADIVSQNDGNDVAMLDLDLHQGTLSHMLGRDSKYSVCDVLSSIHELDEVAMQSTMTKKGNLSLLAAKPFELLMLEKKVDFTQIKELIWKYRHFYKQVILDFSRGPEDWNYELLSDATILLITQQNIMHLRQTKELVVQLTREMGIANEKIHLVVNRYDKHSSISISDIKEAIGIESITTVVNDYKLSSECVELGKPITELAKRQKLILDITSLADKYLPSSHQVKDKKKGFWKRILGG
ncbi:MULTISPECIES: pilus assembly protein CpaE [unclassified Shewanella]|uniref:AAA family ATPase n=1 Tax=unclassified Shewanella TaxID=196818 RepID=UPI001BBB6FEE|nr:MULTISPECIES: pilus assembly protein CpaE [unclassified Shewanella]GIU21312.1 pilus assembly protein CpaE [Shewanella sp. MBTL60-112-B1]GIU39952.1 pilus assembly protein CpaE [Shewanella sp. MBTL60-112-B2]